MCVCPPWALWGSLIWKWAWLSWTVTICLSLPAQASWWSGLWTTAERDQGPSCGPGVVLPWIWWARWGPAWCHSRDTGPKCGCWAAWPVGELSQPRGKPVVSSGTEAGACVPT